MLRSSQLNVSTFIFGKFFSPIAVSQRYARSWMRYM
uniref:Uncharacterized protein n=1 Tax=Anguilla anguilla TaxID=7936 RepID=A0A0E9VNG9_ANGAN